MPRQTLYKPPHPQLEEWPPARSDHLLHSDEPARDVYLDSCAQIAAAVAPHGFKYTESKQRCHREHRGFGNTINFQSSRYNASGRHVQLWMHATVSSHVLQAWRAERLPAELSTEYLAGGMVHLLGTRYAFVQWELADPADRAATIADAVSFIHDEVLPYFSLFEEPATLIARLMDQTLPGLDLRPSVEFAYCYGSKEQAQLVLDRFIRERPDLHDAIIIEQSRASPSLLMAPTSYAEQVAFLRTQYRLT